ncbi:hypothetical protein EDD86DRAFT_253199 [Gorgonomyces haynaldii]|nr:hypothetical protein EDD86DRAFT_253199 [Gorgonomyces haynaldii]
MHQCDFYLSYVSCKMRDQFIHSDYYLLGLHILSTVMYACFLGFKALKYLFRKHPAAQLSLTNSDVVCFFTMLHFASRVALIGHSITASDQTNVNFYTSVNIYLNGLCWIIGGYAIATMLRALLEAHGAIAIVDSSNQWKPSKAHGIIRLVYMVLLLAFMTLMVVRGLEDPWQYTLWRRCVTILLFVMCWFVGAPILARYGEGVVHHMKQATTGAITQQHSMHNEKQVVSNDVVHLQIRLLRIQIWSAVIILYIGLGLLALVDFIIYEMVTDESDLLKAHILCSLWHWASGSYYIAILYYNDHLKHLKSK